MQTKSRIFISHSSKDKSLADKLVSYLENQSLSCWIAPRDIPAGTAYSSEIIKGIRNSRVMVFIFSEHSNVSEDCKIEIERAKSYNCQIIPFRICDTKYSEDLEYLLSSRQHINGFPGEPAQYFPTLLKYLAPIIEATKNSVYDPSSKPNKSDFSGLTSTETSQEDLRRPEPATPVTLNPPKDFVRYDKMLANLIDTSEANPLINYPLHQTLNFDAAEKECLSIQLLISDLAKFEDKLMSGESLICKSLQTSDEQKAAFLTKYLSLDERTTEGVHSFFKKSLEQGSIPVCMPAGELHNRIDRVNARLPIEISRHGAANYYLGLGLLRWKDGQKSMLSPLYLYPARVEMRGEDISLLLGTGDPFPNYPLLQKLEQVDTNTDWSFLKNPPVDHSGLDVPKILQGVRTLINNRPDWFLHERVVLDFFPFSEVLIWRDLKENRQKLLQHDIIANISSRTILPTRSSATFPCPETLDNEEGEVASHLLVCGADSLQQTAVAAAHREHSFVIEAAPGTGRTSTIANIIANRLFAGKKVLYVSDKESSRKKVLNRLKKSSLGNSVLTCQTCDEKGKQILLDGSWLSHELMTAKQETAFDKPANFDQVYARWLSDQSALKSYFQALHQPTPLGKSFYELANRLVDLRIQQVPLLTLSFAEPCKYSSAWLDAQLYLLKEMTTVASGLKDLETHPFRGCNRNDIQESFLQRFPGLVKNLITRTNEIRELLTGHNPEQKTGSLGESLKSLLSSAAPGMADKSSSLEKRILALPSIRQALGRLDEGLRYWRQWQNYQKEIQDVFRADIVNQPDLIQLLRWTENQKGVLNRFLGSLITGPERERLMELSVRGELPATEDLLKKLQLAVKARDFKQRLSFWQTQNPDLNEAMGKPAEWSKLSRIFTDLQKSAEKDQGESNKAGTLTISGLNAEIQKKISEFRTLRDELFAAIGFNALENFGCQADEIKWEDLEKRLMGFETNHQRLREWCSINRAFEKIRQNQATQPFLSEILTGRLPLLQADKAFLRSFLECWILAWIDEHPILRDFSRFEYDQHRLQFVHNSRKLIEGGLFAQLLRARISDYRDQLRNESWYGQESSTLEREHRKTAGHTPVKALLNNAVQHLCLGYKPCMVMSTAHVAEFLPMEPGLFDTVIIDEGSKIATHRALGAIARGKQLIVIGNSKNRGSCHDKRKSGNEACEDLPSLFDECAAVLPQLQLISNYRCPEEGPVSLLNQEFHEGKMATFPGTDTLNQKYGFSLIPLKTASSANEAIFQWISAASKKQENNGRSIGIITMDRKLCSELQNELYKRKLSSETIAKDATDEQFGPVNVTSMQAAEDFEHDIILLQLELTTEDSDVEMGMSGQPGDAELLYNALSQAVEQLIVFSSLKSSDAYPKTNAGNSLRRLIAHLENKSVKDAGHSCEIQARGLNADIVARLQHAKLCIEQQKGISSYRIDLALREKDQFLLAIESDGLNYASGKTVIERDLIRPSILENFGWQCHHVWLIEWLRNPDTEIQKIIDLVEQARIELSETHDVENASDCKPSSGKKKSEITYLNNAMNPKENGQAVVLSSTGRLYRLNGYELPDGSHILYGKSIIDLLKLPENEKIVATVALDCIDENCKLAMATASGMIKTTPASLDEKVKNGITAINLEKGDELVDACMVRQNQHIVMASRTGNALRFPEAEVKAKGTGARAMKGMNLGESKDSVVSITTFSATGQLPAKTNEDAAESSGCESLQDADSANEIEFGGMLLTVSEKGFAKKTSINEYRAMHRDRKGVENFNLGRRTGKVVAARRLLEGDQVVLVTAFGNVVCLDSESIPISARTTQGSRMLELDKGDRVISVIVIPAEAQKA